MPEILVVALVVFLPAIVLIGLAMRAAGLMLDDTHPRPATTSEDDGRWLRPYR